MKNNIFEIFKSLDKWVEFNGNGKYMPKFFRDSSEDKYILHDNYGIQQNREEILEFTKKILGIKEKDRCLEIGLGRYGSTHFLFRQIFKKTITVEIDKDRVNAFGITTKNFFGKHVLDDGKSSFIYGRSNDPKTLEKIVNFLNKKKFDLIFIDGSHFFSDVLADWLFYKELLKKKGIIAFHDCININNQSGVRKFLDFLKVYFPQIKIKKIIKSSNLGIAYYYNR